MIGDCADILLFYDLSSIPCYDDGQPCPGFGVDLGISANKRGSF